jgi:Outer membrane efflux protein
VVFTARAGCHGLAQKQSWTLLERRPAIRQFEQALIAANAQIGVAKAAYFPSISLTGAGGVQSFALATLFAGPAGFWSLAGTLVQPIFTAGRPKGTVRLTEAQVEELVNSRKASSSSTPPWATAGLPDARGIAETDLGVEQRELAVSFLQDESVTPPDPSHTMERK